MRNFRTVITLGLLLSVSVSSFAAKNAPVAGPPGNDPPSICDAIPGNLVVNCGFEAGTFAGWTQSGNLGFTGVDGSNPNSGNFAAFLGPVGSDGILTQMIPTVAGRTYTVSFYYFSDGSTPNDFSAFFNGVQLFSVVNDPAHGYQLYTFTAVATVTGTTELRFQFRDDPGFLFLDDVAVVANPAFLVRYVSNLINGGDGVINITNTGASATANLVGQTPAQNNIDGSLCVNIYTFAADEQEVACCSCLVTPNALWSASVKMALLNSTLTPSFPNEVVIKLISSVPNVVDGAQTCNPATVGGVAPAGGLLAWGTTTHGFPTATGPTFSMAETPFSQATLSTAELARDVQECQFIQILGSGQFGICKGCTNAGLGANAQ